MDNKNKLKYAKMVLKKYSKKNKTNRINMSSASLSSE